MSETIEERARKAAEAAYADEYNNDILHSAEDCFVSGFLAGHAASTRSAVIAELEMLQQTATKSVTFSRFASHLDTRIAQLRAEQGNEQGNEQKGECNGMLDG